MQKMKKIKTTFKDKKTNTRLTVCGTYNHSMIEMSMDSIQDRHGRLFDTGDDQDEEFMDQAFEALWNQVGGYK